MLWIPRAGPNVQGDVAGAPCWCGPKRAGTVLKRPFRPTGGTMSNETQLQIQEALAHGVGLSGHARAGGGSVVLERPVTVAQVPRDLNALVRMLKGGGE